MNTDSSKSRNKKERAGAGNQRADKNAVVEPTPAPAPEISMRVWYLAGAVILALAAFVRLYDLNLKPLHHDEGVNGFFLTNLMRTGVYHYDPANYHGPTLYYFALASSYICGFLTSLWHGNLSLAQVRESGLSTFAIRLVPVFFGVATVWLLLCLRRHIGAVGSLVAAILVTISPGAIFLSRYFIHETQFVFFTLGMVVAALRYYDTKNPLYPILGTISAALLFATKETAMISVGVLLIALGCVAAYLSFNQEPQLATWEKRRRPPTKAAKPGTLQLVFGDAFKDESLLSIGLLALICALLFVLVNIVFYSSFFTYAKGVTDALEALTFWVKTGRNEHVHPWYTYLQWLMQEESMLLILGTVGAVLAVSETKKRFPLYAALWAFGILAAYSLVSYKTPWLLLNFIVPLAIIGGYGVNEIFKLKPDIGLRLGLIAAALLVVSFTGYQAVKLNLFHYDDDTYPYVYAHTQRGFNQMMAEVEHYVARAGSGKQTQIVVTSPDYWPMPWYTRNYDHVGYWGHIVPPADAPIVIGNVSQESDLAQPLGHKYQRMGEYDLRPGVRLVLYVRRDLVEQ
ncbi:MAG: TIGR03663 family protein [Acidobacteria bacterium]|nr:TIGR03663 family protein [Acidobacteriota bacterium]